MRNGRSFAGVCPTVAACACLATLVCSRLHVHLFIFMRLTQIDDGMVLVDFLVSLARSAVIAGMTFLIPVIIIEIYFLQSHKRVRLSRLLDPSFCWLC
jgi:hypothetical protein